MELKQVRITIIGCGLMGGSLGAALHGHCHSIIAVDLNADTLDHIRTLGWADSISSNLADGLTNCDLAILATPPGIIQEIIQQMGNNLPAPAFVMDLGSTKRAITSSMASLPASTHAIGGHPMCGKESSGIMHATPALFQAANFILTPLDNTSSALLNLAHEIIAVIGAHPLQLSPERHDHLLAYTSHLPFLNAAALMHTTGNLASDPMLWQVAANGFKDTTRLAASSTEMMLAIIQSNRQEILSSINDLQAFFEHLASLIKMEHYTELEMLLSRIRQSRTDLFPIKPPEEIIHEPASHRPSA